jgi:cytochrome P450
MARWTPQALRKAAEGLVARVDGPGCLDVVRAFADPMPTLVIADVLDMSTEQVQWLRTCGGAVAALPQFAPSLGDYARIDALCAEVHAMLSNSGWPEGSPRAAAMQPRAGELGYAVADLVFAVTSAAGNTTAASIAATLNLLAHNPVHQAALRDAPELIGAFVRESLRLAGPVRRLARQAATAAMIVGGVAISAGDALLLDIERAHRDLAAFPAPGSIDLSRKGPPLLAFGGGAHACQGAVIGHLQVEAMVWAVLGRFSLLPLPSGGRLVLHPHLRQFASLPLLLVPWPDQARGHSG